jgi:hypothetical protein
MTLTESATSAQDLGLDRDVKGRRRLVGDQHLRVVDERHRDHHPLSHAARELVRVVVDSPLRIRDADQPEQLERPLPGRLLGDLTVRVDRLDELGAHPVEGME